VYVSICHLGVTSTHCLRTQFNPLFKGHTNLLQMSLAHKPLSITQTVANYCYRLTNITEMWRRYNAAEQRQSAQKPMSSEAGLPVRLK